MGRYAFSHTIIRQTLTTALGTAARAQLHAWSAPRWRTTDGRGPPPPSSRCTSLVRCHCSVPTRRSRTPRRRATTQCPTSPSKMRSPTSKPRSSLLEQSEPGEPASAWNCSPISPVPSSTLTNGWVETGLRPSMQPAGMGHPRSSDGRRCGVEPVYGVLAFPARITNSLRRSPFGARRRRSPPRARLLAFEAFKYATHTVHGRESRCSPKRPSRSHAGATMP